MKKLSLAVLFCLVGSTFGQTQIRVTVTTDGPVGLAPVFAAFHDGSYDIFDSGGMASSGLETLAEVGDPAGLVGALPAGVTGGGFAPGGPFPPAGGTGSAEFSVADGQTSFSFASMVLPSNDWFIGNDMAYDISSLINAAPGTTLNFEQTRVYDAGTEGEDFAFAPGGGLVGITTASDPAGGTSTSDPIALVSGPDPFSTFANVEPAGFDTTSIDFTNGAIATVSLTVVPEPASFGLAGMGFLMLLGFRRRR